MLRSSRLVAILLAPLTFLAACNTEDDPTSAALGGDAPPSTSNNPPPTSTTGPTDPSPTPPPASSSTSNPPTSTPPSATPVLVPIITTLANDVKTKSAGTELGIAVYDYTTKEYAGSNDDVPHVSASSPKAIWVAAALTKVGIAPVTPHAAPIFEQSSNDDATAVIKLAGPNFINDFYAQAGMTKSAFTQWFGQAATNSPKALGGDNYLTAKDSIAFLNGVYRGTLLDTAKNDKLKEWMTWSPRTGYGGWLGTRLPASAQDTMMHKAGWLPPPYDDRCVNEIGLIEAAPNHWYAIAILARYANNYTAEQSFVEYASCSIYKAVSGNTTLDCN